MPPANGATRIGGSGRDFPSTLWTAIREAGDLTSPEAKNRLETLFQRYWKPVYWVIRSRWNRSNEDAKDLTQEFFSRFLEKGFLRDFSPERGRFRTFVRAALNHFMLNQIRDAGRIKRGSAIPQFSLEAVDDPPAPDLIGSASSPEQAFDGVWAQALMQDAIALVRARYEASGRKEVFALFEAHDLPEGSPPSYADVAQRFGVTEDSVRGALRRVRTDIREVLRERVLSSISEVDELDQELQHLFGRFLDPS